MLLQREKDAITSASRPGSVWVWNPTHDLRVTRLGDGWVRVTCLDGNRAVFGTALAYVQELRVTAIRTKDEPRWSFSFKPSP